MVHYCLLCLHKHCKQIIINNSIYTTKYPPLSFSDPPIEPANITVNTTCSGFDISYISSDATVLTVTSSNGTIIYNGTVEPSVNFVAINNHVMNNEVYALQLKSYNEVGQSKHVIKNITTDVRGKLSLINHYQCINFVLSYKF